MEISIDLWWCIVLIDKIGTQRYKSMPILNVEISRRGVSLFKLW